MAPRWMTVEKARQIADELSDPDVIDHADLTKHVMYLWGINVTAKTLRESDIETALAQYAWTEDLPLRDIIQSLLMGYFGIERRYLEGQERKRKGTAVVSKVEKIARVQPQKTTFLEEELAHIETALPSTPVVTKPVQQEIPDVIMEYAGELLDLGFLKRKGEKSAESLDSSPVAVDGANTPMETVELCDAGQQETPASILARKLKELPSTPSVGDTARLVSEITAPLLLEAEEFLSCKMKRVDGIWWQLLERDLGIVKADVSFSDVRSLYSEEMAKRKRIEAASSPVAGPDLSATATRDPLPTSMSPNSSSEDFSESSSESSSGGSSYSPEVPRNATASFTEDYTSF